MKLLPLILLPALAACSAGDLRRALVERSGEPLDRVDVAAVEGAPGLFVARCDYQSGWSGYFTCFAWQDGIRWEARIDRPPSEPVVSSVRGFTDPRFKGPLIEVKGDVGPNGTPHVYVYELRGRTLALLTRNDLAAGYDLAALAAPTPGVANASFQRD